jgi:hypothetical protein
MKPRRLPRIGGKGTNPQDSQNQIENNNKTQIQILLKGIEK